MLLPLYIATNISRFVIDKINEAFKSAFRLGCDISFDEATMASKCAFLPGKVYNPLKPHKFGLKLFMTCCAQTGFCYKFEIYQGKDHYKEDSMSDNTGSLRCDDTRTGPAALLRAMVEFSGSHRTVYCDRFYTSVKLFLALGRMGLNACGTIMTNRKGFTDLVIMPKTGAGYEHGDLKMASHDMKNCDGRKVCDM